MAERTDFYGSNAPKCPKSSCSFRKAACSFHSFEPILSKRAKKKSRKTLIFRTFWRRVRDSNPRFLLGTQHFECCTFDHSDNSPYMLFRFLLKNFSQELTERTTKYLIFEPKKTPDFTGFLSGANSQLFKKFRVHAVMTSSVPLRILFCCTIVAFRGGFVNSLLCKIGAFLRIWRRNFGGNRVGGAGERLRRGRGYGKIKVVLDGSARYDCNY